MLDHVSITVSDLDVAVPFYDAVMAAIGVTKVNRSDASIGYGVRCSADAPDLSYFSIKLGDKPEQAVARHWCFKAPDRAAVDAFWESGIANGGTNDRPPGLREIYHPTYYAAFLIDPDGNRIEAVCHRFPI